MKGRRSGELLHIEFLTIPHSTYLTPFHIFEVDLLTLEEKV